MLELKIIIGKGTQIQFEAGEPVFTTDKITILIFIKEIIFYIVLTDTLFFLYINNIKGLSIYLNNIYNKLIK